MWIQVRSMDGKKAIRVDGLSKLTKIEDLRKKLVDPFDAAVERQRLFFRGKQLVDGHSLFDYNVGLNEIIQLIVQQPLQVSELNNKNCSPDRDTSPEADGGSDKENQEPCSARTTVTSGVDSDSEEELQESIYKLGDVIDAQDESMGAWFEAKIIKVMRNSKKADCSKSPEKNNASETPNSDTLKCNIDEMEVDQNENITDKGGLGDKSCDHPKDNKVEITKEESLLDVSKADSSNMDKVNEDVSETILKNRPKEDDGFLYSVIFETYEEDDDALTLKSTHIRPRARHKIVFDNIRVGDDVMVNYNYDESDRRGYWYDAVVTDKRNTRTIKELYATVFVGKDLVPMKDCIIIFRDEVFEIEKAGTQLNTNDPETASLSPVKRQNKPECDHCNDNPKRKCKLCACCVCGDKRDPDRQLMCDECDAAYHLECLTPPLDEIPDVDEWYCPQCKNDESEVVRAGEKLKKSKKKSKMASATSTAKRDWGRGMACVGRTKMCTMVPPNHQGPIPGVEVGTTWKFRVQVSESGCHRPHVAGIHGREDDGAFSLVLSGGYEDDVDEGDQFTYTGSGGRDLSGNKRTAEQSCDQTLTRMNKALAKNCNASLDVKKGAEAKDWRAGRAVRVIRNVKGRKHSKYAPEEGNRYDGIYKVVKYWPNKGKSGFLVWRFLLRRDDPTPAPWTREGKKRIKQLDLTIQYPEGYLENLREKEAALEAAEAENGGGKKRKRKSKVESEEEEIVSKSPNPKKRKSTGYKVDADVAKLIKADSENGKVWQETLKTTSEGPRKFLEHVSEMFMCICCQEIVFKPITTSCKHNICKPCLQRSFKAEVYSCPACRTELDKDCSMGVNKMLSSVLNKLFPGYESGR